MAFTPRTFPEILFDMVAYVQTYTDLTDFTPGSVIRTTLEAAALEDDEQYFQMVQLLDMFNISNATGADLDRRLADYRLYRLPATRAFGKVRMVNTLVKTGQVALDALATTTSVTLFDTSIFPTVGFPYVVRLAEGTSRVQDVDITANNDTTGVLTLDAATPLAYAAEVGDRVNMVTGATTKLVAAGTITESPPTTISPTKRYVTQETATIVSGNLYSNLVLVQAETTGILGNTGINTVTKFTGSSPFVGAGVSNVTAIEGGDSRESDLNFRERAFNQLQSLSRGTPLALKANSIGVTDPETGQRTVSANIVEDFVNDVVIVHVDDGTGFTADYTNVAESTVDTAAIASDAVLVLDEAANFTSSGTVLIYDGADSELVDYGTVVADSLILATGLVDAHATGTVVYQVDVVEDAAELNQRRFRLNHFPVLGALSIFTKAPAGNWTLLADDVDYIINNGTGEFQLTNLGGVTTGTQVVANYDYYTNLVARVQKVLEGDSNDPNNFPGVKAAGISLRVQAATPRRINVRAVLSARPGFLESDLAPSVKQAIENYINSLKIGENVVRAKMIDVAFNVPGVLDVSITTPPSNVVVLEDQVPVAYTSSGNSTVVVV